MNVHDNTEIRTTYTVPEVAAILRISVRGAYYLCEQSPFPVLRIGSSVRIPKKSFDEWFDSSQR